MSALPLSNILLFWGLLSLIFVTYYFYTWRPGYLLDVATVSQVFLTISLVLAYPFAGSSRNAGATGGAIESFFPLVDEAFRISATGLGAMYVAIWMCLLFRPVSNRAVAFATLLGRPIAKAVVNNQWVTVLSSVAVMVTIILVAISVRMGGSLFDIRGSVFFNPFLRPIFNLFATMIPWLFLWSMARFVDSKWRDWFSGIIACGLAFSLAVSGSRGSLLYPLVQIVCCFAMSRQRKKAIIPLLVSIPLLVGAIEILGKLRNNDESGLDIDFAQILFYGNNFSDLRDFAWIMSGWDGLYLFGKTQVAGWLGFIPSFILPFRSEWGWAPWSLAMAFGQVPDTHPGLRPGPFGEMYFNFGIPGVLILGLITGFLLAGADMWVKRELQGHNRSGSKLQVVSVGFGITALLGFLQISSGGFGFYVFWFTIFAFLMLRRLGLNQEKSRVSRA